MRFYLVGGSVRDTILGKHPKEFDIAFDGSVDDFLRHYGDRAHIVGKVTAVYIVNGHEYSQVYNGNISDDLANRDLTINALALDENGIIHALPQTFADLAGGVLRHASPAAFRNDFTRVLRAARFSATLEGFSIHADTIRLMREAALEPGYAEIAAERAGKECMKAMQGHAPGNFLRALAEANALSPWLAPLKKALSVPAGPPKFHGADSVFDHTCNVMDMAAAISAQAAMTEKERALAAWMALCHDFGKLETNADLLPRHIGHESRGLYLAESLAASLRLPALWAKAARIAITLHMKAGRYKELKQKTRVDILHALNVSGVFIPFCSLVVADSQDVTLGEQMQNDMKTMLAVTLPKEWRNNGEQSAKKLRELRAAALPRKNSV